MNPYQSESAQYMRAVASAITANVDLMTTTMCLDCDKEVGKLGFVASWHTLTAYRAQTIVVIGCEGYWHIDPAAVGISSPNWMGTEGVNISGIIES